MLYTAVLARHPQTRTDAVQGIQAHVHPAENAAFALTYVLNGDITRLRIPPPRLPRRADGLWQHTCFEVFIAVKGEPSYCEFNFSPSGEWAAYTFRSYRDGAAIEDNGLDPKITVRCTANNIELDAIVRSDRLQSGSSQTPLRLGLSAVIEESDGTFSYWALKHPLGKPDFHHPDSFALELALPDKSA